MTTILQAFFSLMYFTTPSMLRFSKVAGGTLSSTILEVSAPISASYIFTSSSIL